MYDSAQNPIVAEAAEICPPGPISSRRALSRVVQIWSSEHLDVLRGQFNVYSSHPYCTEGHQAPGSCKNGYASVFRPASHCVFGRQTRPARGLAVLQFRLAILCRLTASNRSAGRSNLSASCCNSHSRPPSLRRTKVLLSRPAKGSEADCTQGYCFLASFGFVSDTAC